MNHRLLYLGIIVVLIITVSCTSSNSIDAEATKANNISDTSSNLENTTEEKEIINAPSDFVPKGFMIFDTLQGDLNKDGVEDYVLIIKRTKKNAIVEDEYKGTLDRNRRGIIVLFKKQNHYELAAENRDCFSSENEEGGVYYPPELWMEIIKGNLFLRYSHGRYGYWSYTFRYQNKDMELIGYDQSENQGPIIMHETSINFLTKKKITKENINEEIEESGDEIFKEKKSNIKIDKLLRLSEIKDFDELEMWKY